MRLAIVTQYQHVTDGPTDGRNCFINFALCIHERMQSGDRNSTRRVDELVK